MSEYEHMDIPKNLKVTPGCEYLATGKSEYDRYWRIYLRECTGEWSGPIGTFHKTRNAAMAAAADMDTGGYLHAGGHKYVPIVEPEPIAPTLHVYRSPYRPLPLAYLPKDVQQSWNYDASDIGAWTRSTRYAFALEIPAAIISQMSLEIVT
jgi:hypothetical protein